MAVGLVVSSQFLFQPFVWRHWDADAIVAGWLEILRDRWVVAACIATAYVATQRLHVAHRFGRPLAAGFGIAAGAAIAEAILMGLQTPMAAQDAGTFAGRVVRWSAVAAAVAALVGVWSRSVRAESRVRQLELTRLDAQRQVAHLRLQALRAQIEPHFLFNTLATVRRLGSTDPAARERLLDHLHTFVALSRSSQPGDDRAWSVRQEIDMARAYLGVVSLRMDGRLTVTFDVEDRALPRTLPPLVLATLVENAVKHGIEPSTSGGSIHVGARLDGDELRIAVTDTGVGFRASGGTGIGLANTRARLRSMFGTRAQLELRANRPNGVVAELRLPSDAAPDAR